MKREPEYNNSANDDTWNFENQILPAFFLQKQLLLYDLINPEKKANNFGILIEIKSEVDKIILRDSINEIILENEVLHTRLSYRDGDIVCITSKTKAPELKFPILPEELLEKGDLELEDVRRFVIETFDLENDFPLRTYLFETGKDHSYILAVFHQSVCDEQTKHLFIQELSEKYDSKYGRENTNKVKKNDFTDFVDEYEKKHGSHQENKSVFWKKYLAGCLASIPLLGQAQAGRKYYSEGREYLVLENQVKDGIKNIIKTFNVTFDEMMLAAYYILLQKYTGQNDLCIGYPFNLRESSSYAKTYGYFENYLPSRVNLDPSKGLNNLVQNIREVNKQVGIHRNIAFEEILNILQIKSTAQYNPLFQTGFKSTSSINYNFRKLAVAEIDSGSFGNQLDLFLIASESKGEMAVTIQYNASRFNGTEMGKFANHYLRILDQLISTPDLPVSSIQVLTEPELNTICFEWNGQQKEEIEPATFLDLFSDIVSNNASRTAISCGGDKLSYRELDNKSSKLANYLTKIGAKNELTIGLCMNRSIEVLVTALGILKSGLAFLPLDPGFPTERLEYMIEHSGTRFVITDQDSEHIFKDNTLVQRIRLDQHWPTIDEESEGSAEPGPKADDLAYLMYTSGSTGKPKGVQITHGSLVNFLVSMKAVPGMNEKDIIAAITTLSFDISVLELFLPIISGAKIIMVDKMSAMDGQALKSIIEDNNVTFLQATPTTWRILLAANWKCKNGFKMLCGGEALSSDLAKSLASMSRHAWNMYGPTETTIWSTCYNLNDAPSKVLIGKPILNTSVYILDSGFNPVPIGVPGELYIGGKGVSKGYYKRDDLTKERFIRNPLPGCGDEIIYRTGDLCRYLEDSTIEYLSRIDFQVKIRGFRIELEEIEENIKNCAGVKNCIVVINEELDGDATLVANIVEKKKNEVSIIKIKDYLLTRLPDYMVPDFYNIISELPLTPNGKIDRKALSNIKIERPELAQQYFAPTTDNEKKIESIWCEILGLKQVGIDDSFFDLGGNSLRGMMLVQKLQNALNLDFGIVQLFEYPSIRKQADFLENKVGTNEFITDVHNRINRSKSSSDGLRSNQEEIAIVGIGIRVPGANSIDNFWANLCNDVESISKISKDEAAPFVDPETLANPNYVLHRGLIDDVEMFDASFFGINPNEAKLMDPQQRVFLELAWSALENAGYSPKSCNGHVGVFASVGDNHYYTENVLPNSDLVKMVGKIIVEYGNMKDYIANRVSYNLDLTGPGVSLNSACSGALTAIDGAIKSLAAYECDMALAGGIDITIPQKQGFMYQENGTFCKDGHCRPFDSKATGTMFCDGAGIVVLKRLSEAITDRDRIYAVIKSSAINNDGSNKVSFLAPSIEGQARVIALAQAKAGVAPEHITYVEAHGTGTPIGDPIEVEGLTKAFRAMGANGNQYCYLGSVKGHIGHPTNSSGVIGVIKTALALYNEKIPGTLHFKNPNPKIDFTNTPFKVVSELTDWNRGPIPRIAGVSSFGFGGTNAHAILTESPLQETSGPSRPCSLLPLSAKNSSALERMTENLKEYFQRNSDISLADAAYTLQTGRSEFGYRRFVVANSLNTASERLGTVHPKYASTKFCDSLDPKIVFMFPGQGAQYINMGRQLYQSENIFRETVDHCAEILIPFMETDIRDILYSNQITEEEQYNALKNTFFTQPAIFVIEYALARLWISWGVKPSILIGHSVGEFVCAVLSGMFRLEDALRLISLRGRLISKLPGGSMLSVRKSAQNIEPLLPGDIQLAASNGPELCVVSGPDEAVLEFSKEMEKQGVVTRQLHTSHAFHSTMMDTAVEPFVEEVKKITISSPTIPFYSTLSLNWIDKTNYNDPEYWGNHMRQPVRFSEAISKLLDNSRKIFLEIGPRNTLTTLTRQHMSRTQTHVAVNSLNDTSQDDVEWTSLLHALGSLWINGSSIDWKLFYAEELRNRIPLPTYSFEKKRYWAEPFDKRVSEGFSGKKVETFHDTKPSHENAINNLAGEQDPQINASIKIRATISEIYGQAIEHFEDSATFMEMGMDSLFLTQFAYVLREKYKLDITFSHLMNEYQNIDLLAKKIVSDDRISGEICDDGGGQQLSTREVSFSDDTVSNLYELIKNATFSEFETENLLRMINERSEWALPFSKIPAEGALPGRDESGNPGWFCKTETGEFKLLELNSAGAVISEKMVEFDPLSLGKIKTVLPITEAQSEIWLSCMIGGEKASCAYNESISLDLVGKVDVDLLRSSIQKVVYRHESLHLTVSANGKYLLVNEKGKECIDTINLIESGDENIQKELTIIAEADSKTPFNLEVGPLIRFKIILISPKKVILRFCAHHIICDGWSLDVILKDIATFYSAGKTEADSFKKETYQFSQYVKLLGHQSSTVRFNSSMEYWKECFSLPVANLELPTDYPRPRSRTYDSGHGSLIIKSEIVDGIKRYSKKTGISVFTLYFAGFNILLCRLSNQSDMVVGIPAAGQPVIGQTELVGHCVNMLPVRSKVTRTQSITDYCKSLQKLVLEAHENHYCTYGSIIKELRLPRDNDRIPLMSVGFTNSRMYEENELKFDRLDYDYYLNPRLFETFDIYLNMREHHGGVEALCQFNSNIFSDDFIRNRLGELEMILGCIAQMPDLLIQEIDIIPLAEKAELAAINNATKFEIPNLLLHELFERTAAENPDAIAIESESSQITYRELNTKASLFAEILIGKGIKQNDFVGVYLDRSTEHIISVLAVLKAGGAFLPLDPDFPKERITYMLSNSQAKVLITQADLVGQIFNGEADVIVISEQLFTGNLSESGPRKSDVQRNNQNLAYLLYTSGSTGNPKGVQISHLAIVNFIISMNRIFPLSARDKVLAITTFSFDISLLEIFLPLAAGARIFLAGKTDVVNGDRLCNIINEQQITFLQATPTTWRMLLFSGRPTLNSLTALCGGEALSESLKKELVQNVKYLWNMYGPTETTVWSTCFQIMDENTPVLIGKPIDNTQLYILDELLQPVPKGVTGDLYIGGAGLSAGYLKQPELTAESFIPDPFSEDAGSRIYKTGDLARMNASGDFQCLGRTGSQVKIRGYRIELGEIENALVLLHNINEVVCTVWERSEYDKQIVAYYRADKEIRHEELIEHLRQSLPNYMIPGFFIFLHDFPKTPNAKTDRKRLPPPEEKVQRVILKSKPEALSSSLENEILIIWKDVLKHENINRKDDFFNIGGHSLLAIDLIQKMNDRIGEYWLLGDLFSNPTVEKLGKLAQDKLPKSTDFVVCLQSEGKKDPIFCVLGMNLYRELAMSMGKTRPVYGLFLPIEQKLINNIREGKYIENKQLTAGEMARDYIREIKKIKPEGPYHILGVSYGGVVAFEIIRQLEIMGELPGSLFMLDTRLSKGISRNWSLYVKHKSRYLFSSCLVQNIRSGLEKAKLIFSQRLDPLKLASKSNELTEDEIVKLRGNVYYRLTRLFESQFNIYNGSAHLFIAEDCQITPWVSYKPDLGWSNYIKGELKIHPVPGDHLGILKKPNVELIAKKINSSLP